jgi:ABC-type oligopeptide transport system substrate-binding subunit
MENMIEAERLLIEDQAAAAPVYHQGSAVLVRPTIQNWVQHPTGTIEFKFVRVD